MATKTIVIWNDFEIGVHFCVLDGDYSHLDGKYINHVDNMNGEDDELSDLFYTEYGVMKQKLVSQFPIDVVRTHDDVIVIQAGFLP